MLETVVQKRNALQETATDFIVTPYNSNFLQVGLEISAAVHCFSLELIYDACSMASKRFDLSLVQYFWTHKAKGFLFKGFFVHILCAQEILVCKSGNKGRKDRGKVINGREEPGKTGY
jgi:hypothetical protein